MEKMYISYRQFLVYDDSESVAGCYWTDGHLAQGFARREAIVSFGTLIEFGCAEIEWFLEPFNKTRQFHRAISVPFVVRDGKLHVRGPEEHLIDRSILLPRGSYVVTAAQQYLDDENEYIALFIEHTSALRSDSRILIRDSSIVATELIETSDLP